VGVFKARQNIEQDDGFLAILFHSLMTNTGGIGPMLRSLLGFSDPDDLEKDPFWGASAKKFGIEATEGPVAVLKIISVFIMVSVFWALFDQHSSTWIAQAGAMSLEVKLDQAGWLMLGGGLGALVGGAFYLSLSGSTLRLPITGACVVGGLATGWFLYSGIPEIGYYKLLPSQIPSSNPIMVMILIPYTTFGLYPLMKKLGWDPKPLRRMTLGMFMAAASFAAVALIQRSVDSAAASGDKIHVVWQLIPYGVITLSEVMVSITGLEFAYSQAPKRMKSVIMGFWLFNVTLGSLLVVLLTGFKGLSPENFFWVFTILMAIAAAIFGVRAKFYRYKDFSQ
jgi:dipeptide/tripeptide permease